MIIIDKDDLDIYRYAVAKIVFLEVYKKKYFLVKNIKYSNCLIVKDNDNEEFIVSLFGLPTIKINMYRKILVFYQTKRNSHRKVENSFSYELFNDDFNKYFDYSIQNILLNPYAFIKENKNAQNIVMEIEERAICAHDTSGYLYKYFSQTAGDENSYNIVDGNLAFMNPTTFNDPFDCECFLSSGKVLENRFRVLCTIEDPKNILMWSYYGTNHKGYCFKYSKHEIIKEIIDLKMPAICIVGHIDYKEDRPIIKFPTKTLSYTNLKSIIDCTFTKYKKWEHEQEYRLVIVSNCFDSDKDCGDAMVINVSIKAIYNGCKGDGKPLFNSKKKLIAVSKLNKDPVDYKII